MTEEIKDDEPMIFEPENKPDLQGIPESTESNETIEKKEPIKKIDKPVHQPIIPEPEEDLKRKGILVQKLTKYSQLFPNQFKEKIKNIHDLQKMKLKELEYALSQVEFAVSSRNAGSITKMVCHGIGDISEMYGPTIGYDLRGMGSLVRTHPEMQDLINEMSIKYDSFTALPVELRFTFTFMMCAKGLDYANKHNLNNTLISEAKSKEHADL